MKLLVPQTCQLYGAILMLLIGNIISGEETIQQTTEIVPDLNVTSTPNNQSSTANLTILTINVTRLDFEKNETEITYKPTVVSPTSIPNNNTSMTNRTRTKEPGRGNKDNEEAELEENAEEYTATEDDENSEEVEEEEEEHKFTSKPSEITLEHIDFVQLRLKHIARSTSNNITELRHLQKKEFKLNNLYKMGWEEGRRIFNESQRDIIFADNVKNSTVFQVPEEYHIALIVYSLGHPTVYADFNKKTREVCSGKDVTDFHYKSYFKLLLLAIQALGNETKFKSAKRFLYRGVGSYFKLEVGQILAFQQFVSTSTSLKVAENFAEETLFEMEGPYHGTTMLIRHHSYFGYEEEVIFSPLQVYQVDSKHEGKHYTRYVLVAYEFKMDGEQCGFEPIFNSTTVVNQNTRINGAAMNNKTIAGKTNFGVGNQLKAFYSSGESFRVGSFYWNSILLLGLVFMLH